MYTEEELGLARLLVRDPQLAAIGTHGLRDVRLPFSAILAVVRGSLEAEPFFPPGSKPEDLGDGAVIERRSKHSFRVYERFEVGQMRFSRVSSRPYLFLRGATIRYLKHYGALLRVHGVTVRWWA